MKLNEVITLLNAGYSKAEIEAMGAEQPAPAPEPEPEAPAPEPEAPAEEPIQGAEQYARLEAKLDALMGIMHSRNLNEGVDSLPKQTSTDILGKIIAPPRKEN